MFFLLSQKTIPETPPPMIMDDLILRMALGGLGVALVAGPLGVFVVWRRMAYFGAALAHSALLGVALGLFFEVHMVFAILAVALAMALVLNALEDSPILSTDTVLGILAHGFLAVGLVATTFMGGDLHLHLDLEATLFGDIMAVSQEDILLIYGGGVAVLGVMAMIWRPLLSLTVHAELARVEGVAVERVRLVFLLLLAFMVALAIKIVGLLLLTSLLIIPAASARPFARTPGGMVVLATVLGGISVGLGLWGSFVFDTPSGPSIVLAALALFALSALAPQAAK